MKTQERAFDELYSSKNFWKYGALWGSGDVEAIVGSIRSGATRKYPQWEWFLNQLGVTYENYLNKPLAHLRILDFACGDGWLSTFIALLGAHVTGVDISAEGIRKSRQRAARHGVEGSCEFRRVSEDCTLGEDNYFDYIVSSMSLHHFKSDEVVRANLYKCLKQGGKLLFPFEPLGMNPIVECVRKLLIIKRGTQDQGEETLTYQDIDYFGRDFSTILYKEYEMISLVPGLIFKQILNAYGKYDVIRKAVSYLVLKPAVMLDHYLVRIEPLRRFFGAVVIAYIK